MELCWAGYAACTWHCPLPHLAYRPVVRSRRRWRRVLELVREGGRGSAI